MMEKILETERLYLRKLNKNDFENLCKILQDSEVMYAYKHDYNMDMSHFIFSIKKGDLLK